MERKELSRTDNWSAKRLQTQDLAPSSRAEEMSAQKAVPAGAGVEERLMEVEGGRMRYLRAGAGPALIFLDGLLGYSFSWRYVMPELAAHATVYAPDMLGAGFSDRAPGIDYSMRATARRLMEFIEKLEIPGGAFDLLGTSYGGAIAMMAAGACLGESRVKVRNLVLVAPANPYSAHGRRLAPFFGSWFGATLFRLTLARMTFLFRVGLRRLYAEGIPPGALEGYMAPMAVSGFFHHGLKIVEAWSRDMRELELMLPRVGSVPTLFVWGAVDRGVRVSSAGAVGGAFPDSRTIVFPGVGHLTYEECPAEFNRVVIEFLGGEKSPV